MRDVVKQNVKRQQSSKRQHRRSRLNAVYFFLVLVLVVGIGAALSMTLFFNVTDVVVLNETDTPDMEIVEMSGIKYQDNLVRLDTYSIAQKIASQIVYAERVSVKKKFPATVVITVEKAVPVANVANSYGYLLVSASNRILEELKEDTPPREGLIIINGFNAAEGTVGMVLTSEDERRDSVLQTLTAAVTESGSEHIVSLDMTDISAITVQFGDRITFNMGSSNDAVYKLRLAEETISKLNPGKRYKLTMVGNNQISVLSDDAPRSVTTAPAVTETTAETTTLPKPADE